MQADSENTRMIHEAYQFLTAKKKKKSGRSMVQVGIHNFIFILIYIIGLQNTRPVGSDT